MTTEINADLASVRSQQFIQLIALVVVTGVFAVFLFRQATMEGKQMAQAEKVIAGYRQAEPNIIKFRNELADFGYRHPDFAQTVLKKYGIIAAPAPH